MSPSVRLTLDADELRRGAPNVQTVTHAADLLRTHGVVALSAGSLERGVTGSAADMATLAADARAHIHILFDAVERFAATPAAASAPRAVRWDRWSKAMNPVTGAKQWDFVTVHTSFAEIIAESDAESDADFEQAGVPNPVCLTAGVL